MKKNKAKLSIDDAVAELSLKQQPALMTHVVLGYPSLKESMDIVRAMDALGVRLIEVQIPFSDPMADGPTIMSANERALEQGVTPADCMKAAEQLAKEISAPLMFMSYYNILFRYGSKAQRNGAAGGGLKTFCRDAASAGVQGLIVPDVPPEETGDDFWGISKETGLFPVPLVSPVTSEKRMKKIAKAAGEGGFVYCVSTTGTTGTRAKLPSQLTSYLKTVRKVFKRPLALGFGISTPQHVQSLKGKVELAIIGSASIRAIEEASPKAKPSKSVGDFLSGFLK